MSTESRTFPTQRREASFVPATYQAQDRTIEVTWTTGARVRRYDWLNDINFDEELAVDEQAVDMARLNSGAAPVLNSHRQWDLQDQIGVVVRAWIDKGQGHAVLKLSEREDVAGLVKDIESGVVRNISVGYSIRRYEVTRPNERSDGGTVPLYRAIDWQPFELSFVPIPADAGAGTRSQAQASPCEFIYRAQPTSSPNQETAMVQTDATTTPPTAPPVDTTQVERATQAALARAADITELATRHGFVDQAADWIKQGKTTDQVRGHILDQLAARSEQGGGNRNVRVETVQDETETLLRGMEQAITHRVLPATQLDDNGRAYRGMSLLEIGREFLQARGVATRGMDRQKLAGNILHYRDAGMHGTSDFANLLSNVANKRLRQAYDEHQGTYTLWARRAPNAPDFKAIQVHALSGAPDLVPLGEHGEFKYGTASDGKETYSVVTHGRVVAFTRQAIINDDLRGFERLLSAFGNSARRLENRLVYKQLTDNGKLSDDTALFDDKHKNLVSGGPSALSAAALSSARTAMRLQKGMQNEELNLSPSYLIVPASLEQTAYQLTSSQYVPAKQGDINEFRQGGRTALEPIVEPILDASSATVWYLAANAAQVDTVEYCYLDGAEGAVIDSEVGFDTDGVSYRCRLDFAAKAIDYRGLYKSNGA